MIISTKTVDDGDDDDDDDDGDNKTMHNGGRGDLCNTSNTE